MIWQTYFKETQKRNLYELAKPLDVSDSCTVFFENYLIIQKFLENGDDPYFGILSHAMNRKTRFKDADLARILSTPHDVYVLHPQANDPRGTFINSVSKLHPNFAQLFDWLLKEIGKSYEWRKPANYWPSVKSNYIIAKSHIWADYLAEYLQPAMEAMIDAPDEIKDLLNSDAHYRSKGMDMEEQKIRLQKFTGFPHYTHHAFLLERLWSVYFFQMDNVKKKSLKIWPRSKSS